MTRQRSEPRKDSSFRADSLADKLWCDLQDAAKYDTSVQLSSRKFERMLDKYVPSAPYSRQTLFESMIAGEPCLLTGYPSSLRSPFRDMPEDDLGPAIIDWFTAYRSKIKHRIFTGPTGVRRDMTAREIALKWRAHKTRFGVTDLYIRKTRIEKEIVDSSVLSRFNLLVRSTDLAKGEEQFSVVFSSRGHVTDSHSDAFDSTNSCFVGRKLWLGWDTYEGMRRGLQDVERIPITRKADFDMDAWLDLPSARWLIVNPGETLFMPVHLTHKVITLEPYLGAGGFFVALPCSLRMLAYWCERVPLWSKRDVCGRFDVLTDQISNTIAETISSLPTASEQHKEDWGADYLAGSAEHFIEESSAARLQDLMSDPRFRQVAERVAAPWKEAIAA